MASSTVAPGSLWGEEGMYDSILLSIMRNCGKIQPFFECIFSFLSRRTDFYIIMEHNQSEMGFPPGVALNMVIQAFKKYEILTRKREAELMREAETRRIDLMTDDLTKQPKIDVPSTPVEHLSKLAKFKIGDSLPFENQQSPEECASLDQLSKEKDTVPLTIDNTSSPVKADSVPCSDEVEVRNEAPSTILASKGFKETTAKPDPPNPLISNPTADNTLNAPTSTASKPPSTASKPPTSTAAKPPTSTAAKPPTSTAAKPPTSTAAKPPTSTASKPPTDAEPVPLTNKTDDVQATNLSSSSSDAEVSSDAYNGSNKDDYVWSQTMTDLDIRVPVPKGTTGKDLKVNIRNDSLKVEILKPERKVLLQGQLLNRVKVEESMWSLDKGAGIIHINVEKNKEIMWKSVFQGEEGIDLTKVDTSRDISEFDQESQAAIQKVTYDHHMKMLGKPTSNEQKAHDILKKAWDAPGSPFKGTPFDPSKVNIAGVW